MCKPRSFGFKEVLVFVQQGRPERAGARLVFFVPNSFGMFWDCMWIKGFWAPVWLDDKTTLLYILEG